MTDSSSMTDDELRDYYRRVAEISRYIIAKGKELQPRQLNSRVESTLEYGPIGPDYAVPPDGSLLLGKWGNDQGPKKADENLPPVIPKPHYSNFFYTPLGKYTVTAGCADFSPALRAHLEEKLGLVEIVPEMEMPNSENCSFGLYAVTKDLDGKPFPMPAFPLKTSQNLVEVRHIRDKWNLVKPKFEVAANLPR